MIVVPASAPIFRSPRGGARAARARARARRSAGAARSPRSCAARWGTRSCAAACPAASRLISLAREPARITFYVALPPPGSTTTSAATRSRSSGPATAACSTSTLDSAPRADLDRRRRALGRGARAQGTAPDPLDAVRRSARHARPPRPPARPGPRLAGRRDARPRRLADRALRCSRCSPRCRRSAARPSSSPSACIASAVALSAAGRDDAVGRPCSASRCWAAAASLLGGALLPPRLPAGARAGRAVRLPVRGHVGRARVERAGGDRPAPGRRRPLLRRHERGRDTAARRPRSCSARSPACGCCRWSGSRWRPGSPPAGSAPTAAGSSSTSPGSSCSGCALRRSRPRAPPPPPPSRPGAALLLVGIDAATGGSSHVTKAVGGGPGCARSATSATGCTSPERRSRRPGTTRSSSRSGIAALVVLALRRPRSRCSTRSSSRSRSRCSSTTRPPTSRATEASRRSVLWLLGEKRRARLAASVDSRRMRRLCPASRSRLRSCSPAAVAEQVVLPTAETVIGTVPATDAADRGARRREGRRGALHSRRAAAAATPSSRPKSNGTVGPDLDKLPGYAKTAGQAARRLRARVDREPERLRREGVPADDAQLRTDAVRQADRRSRRVRDPEAAVDRPQSRAGRSRPRSGRARSGRAAPRRSTSCWRADERWRELEPQVDELRAPDEAEGQADARAGRGAEGGQGRARRRRGGARARPRRRAGGAARQRCRTRRDPVGARRRHRGRLGASCGGSASRPRSRSSRETTSTARPAGSTSSAARGSRARASATSSATSRSLELALYRWALDRPSRRASRR